MATVIDTIHNTANTLYDALRGKIEKARLLLRPFGIADMEYRFRAILQPRLIRFDDAKEALLNNMNFLVNALRGRLELASAVLETGSPLAVMERGFSMVLNAKTGKVVRYAENVTPGDRLIIRPLKGKIMAITEECDGEDS
jgi:exodeoxyribonuclease VII large subunit